MANQHDSIGRTFAVVGGLCLICSILVAGSAVGLRPWQEAAKARDRQANILSVAQLPQENIRQTYQQRIKAELIDLTTGEFVAGNADTYDMVRAAKDPARSIAIPADSDVAGIRRRAKLAPVYFVKNEQGQTETLILPFTDRAYGQPCTVLSPCNPMAIRLKASPFMIMAKPPVWAVKSRIHAGRRCGRASSFITLTDNLS